MHFLTENTLLSGMLMPPEIEDLNDYQVKSWDTVPFMEIRQQEELAEMYGILLNSPSVKGVRRLTGGDCGRRISAECARAGWYGWTVLQSLHTTGWRERRGKLGECCKMK